MGRPLNKKYFGHAVGGGESLLSVGLGTAGSGYSQGLTTEVSAPGLPFGTTALVNANVNSGTGAITGYTVVNEGAGYMSAPSVALVKPANATAGYVSNTGPTLVVGPNSGIVQTIYTGMVVSGTGYTSNQKVTNIVHGDTNTTLTLSAQADATPSGQLTFSDVGTGGRPGASVITRNHPNIIKITASVPGGTGAREGTILRQTGNTSYVALTADGIGIVSLAAVPSDRLAPGQANLIATDSNGSTYYVIKLTDHLAYLVQQTVNGQFEFSNNTNAPWSLDAAVPGIVQINNT